jgi:hypothetical protein
MDFTKLNVSQSVVVNVPAEKLYEMVTDVTRMGEWSPACTGGRWDDGAAPAVGAWFTGTNKGRDGEYETRNEVTAADGSRFSWVAGGTTEGWSEWSWAFAPVDGGAEVTESWQARESKLLEGLDDERAKGLVERQVTGIAATLAAFKAAAEG